MDSVHHLRGGLVKFPLMSILPLISWDSSAHSLSCFSAAGRWDPHSGGLVTVIPTPSWPARALAEQLKKEKKKRQIEEAYVILLHK